MSKTNYSMMSMMMMMMIEQVEHSARMNIPNLISIVANTNSIEFVFIGLNR